MPFIRLSDNYIDHPKFTALSDGAFRLWHEAMAFCRRHQTDGLIPEAGMKQFPTFRKDRLQHLLRPYREGKNALLQLVPGFGYKVHDYLEWNLSREEEQSEQSSAAARMRKFRARQQPAAVSSSQDVTPFVTASSERVTNALVPDRIGEEKRSDLSEKGSGEKPRQSAGAMVGMLPRDHLRHEACGRVCLQDTQFQEFVRLFGGEPVSAAAAVRRWATEILAEWDHPPKLSQTIGGNRFQFWQARWSEWHPTPVSVPASAGDDAMWAAIAKKGPSSR